MNQMNWCSQKSKHNRHCWSAIEDFGTFQCVGHRWILRFNQVATVATLVTWWAPQVVSRSCNGVQAEPWYFGKELVKMEKIRVLTMTWIFLKTSWLESASLFILVGLNQRSSKTVWFLFAFCLSGVAIRHFTPSNYWSLRSHGQTKCWKDIEGAFNFASYVLIRIQWQGCIIFNKMDMPFNNLVIFQGNNPSRALAMWEQ